jgi:acyl carrier protein
MNTESTEKLQDIFRAIFTVPTGEDVTTLQQKGNDKWDSLAHVSLVAAIESEFDVSIDAADQMCMTSYAETQALLAEKGV